MKTGDRDSMQRLARIRLVARTRIAWDQARQAVNRGDAPEAVRARIRLDALNRALALLALQA
jgi:hypothetical protein